MATPVSQNARVAHMLEEGSHTWNTFFSLQQTENWQIVEKMAVLKPYTFLFINMLKFFKITYENYPRDDS